MNNEIYTAFKAYDIRGESPKIINDDFAHKLGLAIAGVLKPKKVMVSRDMRLTSPELEESLIAALTKSGVDVVKVGLCSTPMFNVLLGLADGDFDLGVMVTASHNPGIYNGFKLTRGDCLPLGLGSGLENIRDAFMAMSDVRLPTSDTIGSVLSDDTSLDRYIDYILKLADLPDDMPEFKVVIDAGNGMSGFVLPKLLERCPWLKSENLFFELDGNFPNHEANPLKPETLETLKKRVEQSGATVGIAFDGDADRVGFVDEKAEQISGDLLTAILAKISLKKKPGSKIMCDTRASWSVAQAVETAGGVFEWCKVGHANIKNAMRKNGAVFSGELSMHFYYHELWNVESGDYTMLLLLKEMHLTGKTLGEMLNETVKYFHSDELNYKIKDAQKVFNDITNEYKNEAARIFDMDGIRYEFGDPLKDKDAWWFSLRSAGTEPLVRLNVEAVTKELMESKIAELEKMIKKN